MTFSFWPGTVTPGQVIVDLDEIVVAQYWLFWHDPAGSVHHTPFQLLLEPRVVIAGMDKAQRHPKLVFETQIPESSMSGTYVKSCGH